MKIFESRQFLVSVQLLRERVESFDRYPFNLPAVRNLTSLDLESPVTMLIGENGTGKSTLLEAIAVAWGFNAEGGSRNFNFSSRESHSALHTALRLVKSPRRWQDGYFLRAESFYNVATEVENLGVTGYGARSLHAQSHGESFMALLQNRFRGNGFYVLDEPEAALSPTRQLAMLVRIRDLVNEGSQFLIATHSPILMAYPEAQLLQIEGDRIADVQYEETEHFRVTRMFLNNREKMLRELFK